MYVELLRKPRSGTETGRIPSNSWFLNKIDQSSEDQVKGFGRFLSEFFSVQVGSQTFQWLTESTWLLGGQTSTQSKPHPVLLYEPQFSSL